MKLLSLFASLILFVPLAAGQEASAHQLLKKNTFSLSYSPISSEGWHTFEDFSPTIIEGHYGYAAVGYNIPTYSGVIMLSYSRRFVPEFEMTLDLGYEQEWKGWKLYNNPAGPSERLERDHYLYCLLNASLLYVSKKKVEMYSSLGIGGKIVWDNTGRIDSRIESTRENKLAYQVTLFGIRAKYDWWGFFCNVGVGSLGFVRAGLFMSW